MRSAAARISASGVERAGAAARSAEARIIGASVREVRCECGGLSYAVAARRLRGAALPVAIGLPLGSPPDGYRCSRSWPPAARVRGDGLLAFVATGCFWSVERLLARHIRARVRPIGVVR